MGQNGRLVAKYAWSSKLPKRMSLIISGMNFGDMLDIAKWLRLRRKCPGRDLLLTARLPHRHRIAGNAAVAEPWEREPQGRASASWLAQNGCVTEKCSGFVGNRVTFPEWLERMGGRGGPGRYRVLRDVAPAGV